jgi:hypothetical protein
VTPERDRVDRRVWLLGGAAILVAAVALALARFVFNVGVGTIHDLDGQGPLGSTGDPTASSGFTFDADSGTGPWTVGYLVCLVQGNGPAVIESIGPARTDGNGYRYLGGMVRELNPSAGGGPLIETDGYPPAVAQPLHPAIGYAVTAPCSSDVTGRYTELDLGFTRAPGTRGGGWTGINIGYRVGSQQYVVTLAYQVYVCGPAIPDAGMRQACTTSRG